MSWTDYAAQLADGILTVCVLPRRNFPVIQLNHFLKATLSGVTIWYFMTLWTCRTTLVSVIHLLGQCYFPMALFQYIHQGPVVQNITNLLASVTLKYLLWNMAYTLIILTEKVWVAFALQNLLNILQQNYQCIWKYLSYIINKFVTNKLIKLTMIWTNGPRPQGKKVSK